METVPLEGAFGVEVRGLDLSGGLDEADGQRLHELLLANRLLVFRDQELGPAQLREIGSRFGTLDVHPFIEAVPDFPEVIAVVKEADEVLLATARWKCSYPDQVHFLLSNHELAQVTGHEISKNGRIPRAGSPLGGSSFTTSAPQQPRRKVA